MTTATVPQRGDSRRTQAVLVLMAISVFINYVDRGNLSIAAPMLKDELGISTSQLAFCLRVFLAYACLTAVLRLAGGPFER